MAADHVDGEKSTFRCLDAARYVVAAAVTVLIVTVIVYAVVLIFRSDSLTLVVDGGSVSVRRHPSFLEHGREPRGPSLLFFFSVTAINTSGRSRLYFTNIIATFSGRNASGDYYFLQFQFKNMTVAQQSAVTSSAQTNSNRTMMDMSYFDSMYKNLTSNISTIIPEGMLQLDGYHTVELYGVHNKSSTPAIYYCRPLAIGDNPSERQDSKDVTCTGTPPATLPILT